MGETILDKELETYHKRKAELLKNHGGEFVLIKGEEIIGIFESQKDAINTGTSKFGGVPFLVKKIEEIEETHNFTSNLIYERIFTAAPLRGQNIDSLIGRDLLSIFVFIYLGYVNQFTLSY